MDNKALVDWLQFQIEHGHAPGGFPIKMDPVYEMGRRSAFEAVLRLVLDESASREMKDE